MINYTQSVILGLLQGVTELFPISSLGHTVILPSLFGWSIDQKNEYFLLFLVATHFATAIVLLAFFYKDWLKMLKGMLISVQERKISEQNTFGKLGWLLVSATLPVGIIGLLFEKTFKELLGSPKVASLFLVVNGLILFGAEVLRRKRSMEKKSASFHLSHISWLRSIKVGISQCLALIPGISRTGSTLATGLLVGLSHEDAAHFSFLLATPVILGASVVKLPKLVSLVHSNISIGPIVIGSIVSAVAAYFSVRFLTKYFERKTLVPFALYCFIAGIVFFIAL